MNEVTKLVATRRLPIGAEPQPGGGVHFRVWAPRRKRVVVELHPAITREIILRSRSHSLPRGAGTSPGGART